MEKEFVQYEQALALKKLGFDEPCFGYHLTKDLPYVKRGLKFGSEKYVGKHNSYDDFIVSAPTYSAAFRWFREKYGYWSYVKEAAKGTCRFYIEKFDEKFFNSDIIDTYEEAELACLTKLIEIKNR